MPRKVFISVLGAQNRTPFFCKKDGYKSNLVRYYQEGIIDYLCKYQEWTKEDVGYIFMIPNARQNWVDDGMKDWMGGIIKKRGLENCLRKKKLDFVIFPKDIPLIHNESDVWTIFNLLFEIVQDGDELYFDVTEAKSISMLIMSFINYALFLKDVKVKMIISGEYDPITGEATLVDLLPLQTLQEWTYAAASYMETGRTERLVNMSKKELENIIRYTSLATEERTLKPVVEGLNSVTQQWVMNRGIDIISAKDIKAFNDRLSMANMSILPALNPVFTKLKKSLSVIDTEGSVINSFAVAVWSFEHGLYQSSITLLRESVVSYFCDVEGLDYKDKNDRSIVELALWVKNSKFENEESHWQFVPGVERDRCFSYVKHLLSNSMFSKKLSSLYQKCTEVRNDFNHAGMRKNCKQPNAMKSEIKQCIDSILSELNITLNQK